MSTKTTTEHIERHKQLHAALDELVADYLAHAPARSRVSLRDTSVMALIEWSHAQTLAPTPAFSTLAEDAASAAG